MTMFYIDNNDGRHKIICRNGCALEDFEAHTFVDGVCDKCGAEETTGDEPGDESGDEPGTGSSSSGNTASGSGAEGGILDIGDERRDFRSPLHHDPRPFP